MARVKSPKMRDSIVLAADQLFAELGYVGTTISRIAKNAGTATSNVYVYFPSKMEIAFAVFDPWLREQIKALEARVAEQVTPRQQLEVLVRGLLQGIAAEGTGRTLTLVQALATAKETDAYSSELLRWTEGRILAMICRALPRGEPATLKSLAHVLMLSFDGIALRQNLRRGSKPDEEAVHSILTLLFEVLDARR